MELNENKFRGRPGSGRASLARGIRSYQAPPRSFLRRFLGRVVNRWTLSILLVALLAGFVTLGYFWFEFSDRIDQRLLSGEIFTPSAGIYSAPKTLRIGESISVEGLADYLRSAGYIEKNDQAGEGRSRYSVDGQVIVIEPGITGIIDEKKAFPSLKVTLSTDGKRVDRILDMDTGSEDGEELLEPKMLSTIAAEGDGRRKTVTFEDIPLHLIKAITVTEDRAFFDHYGVNFRGIARAAWRRYEGDDDNSPLANQGGSSITQQLIKNLFLNNELTLERKLSEALMSVILETRLAKDDIFTLYANQIYLGQQNGVSLYGIGEASYVYFGQDVTQLTLSESAFLAGIIRSPNRYNPFKNRSMVTERRNQVLDSMVEAGEITAQQGDEATAAPLALNRNLRPSDRSGMAYFSQYVIEELPNIVNDPTALQHLRVYSSIDPDLQLLAYRTVNEHLEKLDKHYPRKPKGSLNAALVAMRPATGEIVAMVGGRDFQTNQFNRAVDANRQPGSVFKPFVYAAAINSAYESSPRVFTPASIFKDEKKVFTFEGEEYSPKNYGGSFSNSDITLRDALVKSKNAITVDIAVQLNISKVMSFAHKAGFPKVEKAYPAMALGTAEATPLQVAAAYTTFANLGDRVRPSPISQITDGSGRLVASRVVDKKNVVRPDVAYLMNDIMKDVVTRGTAAELRGWNFGNGTGKGAIAGKTGTSRDGWFAGFTPEIVCVVYVGFDDGSDLEMKGSDSAMPIWADFMKAALDIHPEWDRDWEMPANIKKAEIDIRTGSVVRELEQHETSTNAEYGNVPSEKLGDEANPRSAAGIIEPFDISIPSEYRRVELFIAGTLPAKALPQLKDQSDLYLGNDPNAEGSSPGTPKPKNGNTNSANHAPTNTAEKTIVVMACPLTGMKAGPKCHGRPQIYAEGTEPKGFCTYHK
ncbi:MAG: PBP1A family penicillin-binding protein [Pyrinomonadaceae bacterium]